MNRRIYKLRIMHRTPLVLATALLTSVSAFAQTKISSEAQLKAIANDLNGKYVLTQNITLSDDEWTPIGTKDRPFTGTLDGKGFTIKGLTVGNGAKDDSNNNKAFFGFTKDATVENIAFTNAVVKGHNQAAIVVAQATSSTLSNIYVSGVVTGRDHVGTIAGDARSTRGTTDKPTTITNCVSTAAALSTEHQGGGIAGWTNNSIFSYNIAYGAVTAPGNGAGGITGMVDDNGKTEYKSNISAALYIKGHKDHTRGINGWCNNNCSNTNSGGNLSWAGTEYYLGGTKTEANNITDGNGIHGTVTTTENLKKAATYKGLGFNGDTWILEDGKSPRLKQFPNISDAVSISGLPDIITKGQTVIVTATSALNRPITITSSNSTIISVSGNTLKAEKYGTCEITIASEKGEFVDGANEKFTITVPKLQVTYKIGDGPDVTSEDGTEGSLATLLGGNAMRVTQLSVKGYLNDADINLLKKMAGIEGNGSLKSLNLSEATFTKTGKKVPDHIFKGCGNLQQVDLSNMTEIGQWAFQNCALTEISIPATVTKIGVGAFSGNSAVTKVIVHSGTQIDARSYDGEDNIFYDMDPNKVQVVFEGAAEPNYKFYRNDIKDGNNVYKNAFMYLLTKTLDENATDYTVVAQRHADVRLYRTFKEGWNTLVLPFGARYLKDDPEPSCSSIFQRALNASNTEGFMIAAYRGLAKNEAQPDNSTFYFLKYANYNSDPLDECEPLLIRMTQKDIDDAKGVYTFKNIELNFDGDFDEGTRYQEYTAEQVKLRMGKKEDGKYFTGNYNHENNDKFKNCTYDDFYFTGTLYQQVTDENSDFIAPGDYIIQNNTFVKCLSGKKYGLKGFRGYFKKLPSSTSHAKGNIGICLVDRNGVVSSIHQVDGASLTSASVAPVAVYNLSGQQVGNSLSTLAKGVYIVKGKKFVKK